MMSDVDKCIHMFYNFSLKVSQYAKQQGISYRTALRWFRTGAIKGYQAPSGTIIVTVEEPQHTVQKVAIYARVSTASPRANLERQAERLLPYCQAWGYQVLHLGKRECIRCERSSPAPS